MAYFKCTGGLNPTGNASEGQVVSGYTFSNANGVDKVGSFAAQEKTITSSRWGQEVYPDSGRWLSKVTVNQLLPDGAYNATTRANWIDMGERSNYRYVHTTSVPNTNSGTYTYASNSTGGTIDLGETNTYRYVNASNVYWKGVSDGRPTTATLVCNRAIPGNGVTYLYQAVPDGCSAAWVGAGGQYVCLAVNKGKIYNVSNDILNITNGYYTGTVYFNGNLMVYQYQ